MARKFPSPPLGKLGSAYLFCIGRSSDPTLLITDWLTQLSIHAADQVWLGDEEKISIDAVRSFQRRMLLAPIQSPWRVGIIPRMQNLSIEASNALLKMLEDPPGSASFFLLTEHADQVLPTIRSRCQRVRVLGNQPVVAVEDIDIQTLKRQSFGQRLKLAEGWAKEERVIPMLDSLVQALEKEMLANREPVGRLEEFFTYRAMAETNVSPRLLAEVALVSLGKDKDRV